MSRSNQTFRIAVLPGDGIGPEVMAEGVKVLRVGPLMRPPVDGAGVAAPQTA